MGDKMAYPRLDRNRIQFQPLRCREHTADFGQVRVDPDQPPGSLHAGQERLIDETVGRIQQARRSRRPVMLAFGAHTIKNGLAPVLARLVERRWVTHLATNGAGIIHDWEFAYQGKSCENVRQMVAEGRFGNWEETGRWINLALAVGAYRDRGYGESVGSLIAEEGLELPSAGQLVAEVRDLVDRAPAQAASAADLLEVVRRHELTSGWLEVPHRCKAASIQAAAYEAGVPFTGHPMIGHDIIYNHPLNRGAAIGRTAERDFLTFAHSVSEIEGGVYLSVGSAIMSPMVFEKSMSLAQNLARQRGCTIRDHYILVVDLARSDWDWSHGEPPTDHPAYYLRYNKTFHRMGGAMNYLCCDNRDFLLSLCQRLCREPAP